HIPREREERLVKLIAFTSLARDMKFHHRKPCSSTPSPPPRAPAHPAPQASKGPKVKGTSINPPSSEFLTPNLRFSLETAFVAPSWQNAWQTHLNFAAMSVRTGIRALFLFWREQGHLCP